MWVYGHGQLFQTCVRTTRLVCFMLLVFPLHSFAADLYLIYSFTTFRISYFFLLIWPNLLSAFKYEPRQQKEEESWTEFIQIHDFFDTRKNQQWLKGILICLGLERHFSVLECLRSSSSIGRATAEASLTGKAKLRSGTGGADNSKQHND